MRDKEEEKEKEKGEGEEEEPRIANVGGIEVWEVDRCVLYRGYEDDHGGNGIGRRERKS